VLLIVSGINSLAQNLYVDSLRHVLLMMEEDTNRVNALNTLAYQIYRTNAEEAISYGSEARDLAEKIGFRRGLADAYKNTGLGYYMQGEYIEVLRNWEPALNLYMELEDEQKVANILSNLSAAYYTIGGNKEAFEYSVRVLEIAEQLGDSTMLGTLLLNIGLIYSEQTATLDSALSYLLRALHIAESIGNTDLLGIVNMNLGKVYQDKKEYDSALHYYLKSLTIVSRRIDIATSLSSIGGIYTERGEYEKAVLYYNDALDIAGQEDASFVVVGILLGLATTYEKQEFHTRAIEHYKKAVIIGEEMGLNSELSTAYEGLALNYAEVFDFQNAYKYLSLQNILDNTIHRIETENQTRDLISTYQLEKKQNEIEILEQSSKIEQLASRRQRAITLATGLFGLLLLAIAFGLNSRMNYIRKTNEKINTQHGLITDSISYAQRIQTAILPSQGLMDSVMPEHFVILKPRDIISGDFYWIKEVQDHLVIVGADCTGHGVPGAFMSILGITLLNDLIGDRCFDAPGAILEQMRHKVKEMLVQEGERDEQKEGMDMALAILNRSTRELHFAGANNPLYLIRDKSIIAGKDLEPYTSIENGNYQLYELKGDRQPIGVYWEETSFTNRSIMLNENDSFYIFSDGFVDQFGGEHRKKFKSRYFKKLLLSVQDKSMVDQKQLIEDAFDSWRGDQEQIDDVSVIGVRV